jgi:hypothetical protein
LADARAPFHLELGNGPVRGAPASEPRLARAHAIVRGELARYPRSFLTRIALRGVVLAAALAEGERPIPSLPNVAGLLLLDVGGTQRDLVRGLHHEIFHFADVAGGDRVAPDPAWEALNDQAWFYGAGGRTMRNVSAAAPSPEVPGFVSGYAASGVEEDKAETFAFLVARPDDVRPRLAGDPVLAAKVQEIQRRVEALDPEAKALVR